mmetsp:Transcript_67215/g.146257  ORF Transcript_67215/g.146257 Transcript_67215/m.146257 type:complete len:84 (-) Transcript_67215:538-789(-)
MFFFDFGAVLGVVFSLLLTFGAVFALFVEPPRPSAEELEEELESDDEEATVWTAALGAAGLFDLPFAVFAAAGGESAPSLLSL